MEDRGVAQRSWSQGIGSTVSFPTSCLNQAEAQPAHEATANGRRAVASMRWLGGSRMFTVCQILSLAHFQV